MIEQRPFDYCFQRQLLQTWKKVGIIPTTANAVNDPKVRHELGEGGGAPAAEQERLTALVVQYGTKSDGLTAAGFNGELLDLEPRQVIDETIIPESEEEQAQKILVYAGMYVVIA